MPAQIRMATVITPEAAMKARVGAYSLSDYRIALMLQACLDAHCKPSFAEARAWLASDPTVIADLAVKQAADPKP